MEIVDGYEPEINISGTNSGCFGVTKRIQTILKKKLWEYCDELNTWIYSTVFNLQIK